MEGTIFYNNNFKSVSTLHLDEIMQKLCAKVAFLLNSDILQYVGYSLKIVICIVLYILTSILKCLLKLSLTYIFLN